MSQLRLNQVREHTARTPHYLAVVQVDFILLHVLAQVSYLDPRDVGLGLHHLNFFSEVILYFPEEHVRQVEDCIQRGHLLVGERGSQLLLESVYQFDFLNCEDLRDI